MWNPSRARAMVQGVFHPSYRSLQAQAATILGQRHLSIIKGGGGEFERHPSKDITIFGLRDGAHIQEGVPPIRHTTRRLHEADHGVDPDALWHGAQRDDFATATVTGTAALALWTLKAAPTFAEAEHLAQGLWAERHQYESLSV
jgi:anthranilate phosphoribosyltransferase